MGVSCNTPRLGAALFGVFLLSLVLAYGVKLYVVMQPTTPVDGETAAPTPSAIDLLSSKSFYTPTMAIWLSMLVIYPTIFVLLFLASCICCCGLCRYERSPPRPPDASWARGLERPVNPPRSQRRPSNHQSYVRLEEGIEMDSLDRELDESKAKTDKKESKAMRKYRDANKRPTPLDEFVVEEKEKMVKAGKKDKKSKKSKDKKSSKGSKKGWASLR